MLQNLPVVLVPRSERASLPDGQQPYRPLHIRPESQPRGGYDSPRRSNHRVSWIEPGVGGGSRGSPQGGHDPPQGGRGRSPDDAESKEKPPPPPVRNVVSGNLPGMGIAKDLMYIDFRVPNEELEYLEAKAIPWNLEYDSKLEGYGPYTPQSNDLETALARLEAQQAELLQMLNVAQGSPSSRGSRGSASSPAGRGLDGRPAWRLPGTGPPQPQHQPGSRGGGGHAPQPPADEDPPSEKPYMPGATMGPQYFRPRQAEQDAEYGAPSMGGRPHTPQRIVKESFHTGATMGPEYFKASRQQAKWKGEVPGGEPECKAPSYHSTPRCPESARSTPKQVASPMGAEYFTPRPQPRKATVEPPTPADQQRTPAAALHKMPPAPPPVQETREEEPLDEWSGLAAGRKPTVNGRSLRPKKKEKPAAKSFTAQPEWRRPVTAAEIATAITFTHAKTAEVAGRPAHINIWGCLLFATWIASFGVYIGVRAAKTIDRHSSIFAYQVVILMFESLAGLVTAQQGFALVARLTSVRTLKEQEEADITELVKSGKSKPVLVAPPDLPYPPVPSPATPASSADAAAVTARNTSALTVVPPRHATARITQGSSSLANIIARLPGGGPARATGTTDSHSSADVRNSLDVRSNPSSHSGNRDADSIVGGPRSEDGAAALQGGTADSTAAVQGGSGRHIAVGGALHAVGLEPGLPAVVEVPSAEAGIGEDAVMPLHAFGGTLPKAQPPAEDDPVAAPPSQPPPCAEAAVNAAERKQLAEAAAEVGSSSSGGFTARRRDTPAPAEMGAAVAEAAGQLPSAASAEKVAADSQQSPLSHELSQVPTSLDQTGGWMQPLADQVSVSSEGTAHAAAAAGDPNDTVQAASEAAAATAGVSDGADAAAEAAATRQRTQSSVADDPFVLEFGRVQPCNAQSRRASRIDAASPAAAANAEGTPAASSAADGTSAMAAAAQHAAPAGTAAESSAGVADAATAEISHANAQLAGSDVVLPPALPFYRDQADAPMLAGATARVHTKASSKRAASGHHIQVLVWAAPHVHLGALEATLRHLMGAALPPGCTRAIYVVDAYRSEERALSVAEQGYEGVSYIPTLQRGQQTDDFGKAACLNRALRRLYPTDDAAISDTDLMAVFDGGQGCEKPFFERAIAALQAPAVALAAAPPAFARLSASADVFDLTQRAQQLRTKGSEALGLSWAWDSGFVVAAASLRAVGWLPEHSEAIGPALGSALRGQDLGSAFVDGGLAPLKPPGTLHKAYAAVVAQAAGHFQMLFWRKGLQPRPRLRHRLLYSTQAIWLLWNAAALFVWLGIPLVQILLGVFPARVNRWLGIVAAVYYGILTPLLFQGYRLANRASLWHSAIVSHALAPRLLAAAAAAALWGRKDVLAGCAAKCVAAAQRARAREDAKAAKAAVRDRQRQRKQEAHAAEEEHRTPATWRSAFPKRLTRDFREAGDREGHFGDVESSRPPAEDAQDTVDTTQQPMTPTTAAAVADNDTLIRRRPALEQEAAQEPLDVADILEARPRKPGSLAHVPWFAAAVWAVTGAATGMGLWLLFSRHDPSLHMLAANLPLVVSTLWALAHHVTAGMALWFALGLRRKALGVVASASEGLCWLLAVIAAAAAIGLGGGGVSVAGQRIRNGFVQAMGAYISGTPAN